MEDPINQEGIIFGYHEGVVPDGRKSLQRKTIESIIPMAKLELKGF